MSELPTRSTLPARSTLPTGTVTFLFSDIEGNTPLWERDPVKMDAAMQVHHAILRQAIEANGGVVFKVIGDEFQAAFPTAPQALLAALQAQRGLHSAAWNELGALRVRMGMHTGEAHLDAQGDEYAVSHTKNRGHRVMEAGHGGQILLSQESADLCQRSLPEGVTLKDLGEHHIRNWKLPEHFYQVVAPDLPKDFPPLRTQVEPKHNLPVQLTSFIGREQEIEQVKDLLKSHRLVTLTGSGGTGKTRLSLQVAGELLGRYPDGTWLVELAPLADPNFVPQAVAAALNLPEMPGKRIIDSLLDYLRSKRLLLILDNCEHLLEACTSLADKLLRSCPELSILVSSREFLGVKGEVPYRVPPMALPDAHLLPPVEQLAEYDAVRLFVERARLVSSGFTVTESNAAAVAHVVNRLDGIPLAIELAAARLRMLSVDQVALRLNDAFRLLTGGSRTVLPRHQTLRAMIDWSYNLLTEAERTLLRRLSVFAGSWVLEAAEQVCSLDLEECLPLCPDDVFDLLAGLVDKSLVLPAQEGKAALRFRMLETIRQYAHEKLVDEKEAAAVRTRHLLFYLGLAEELGPKIRSHGQIQTLDRLELELDNLRLALEWALQTDLEAELSISAALHWFWQIREHFLEAIDWLERGLEAEKNPFTGASKGLDLSVRAKGLTSLGYHRWIKGSVSSDKANPMDETTKLLEEALALYRGMDVEHNPEIRRGLAWVLVYLGWQQIAIGNYDQAQVLSLEALDAFGEIGDQHGIAECLGTLGACEIDPARKMKLWQEKLAVGEADGDVAGVAGTHRLMGFIAFADGEYEKARKAFEVSKEFYRRISHPREEADQLTYLGWCSLYLNDLPGADQYLQQSQAIFYELGYNDEIIETLFLHFTHRLAQGLYDQAAEALDTAWHIQQKLGNQMALGRVLYMRARLARLNGDTALARKYVDELLSFTDLNFREIMLAKVEAGHLALQSGDLERAGFLYREAIQNIIRLQIFWTLTYPLDGLALVAVQKNKLERAARLIGTRWCRGVYHFLAPSERDQRKNNLASIRANLGEERFEQLYEQGRMLSLQQALALALEE